MDNDYGYGRDIASGACYVAMILMGILLGVLYLTPPGV